MKAPSALLAFCAANQQSSGFTAQILIDEELCKFYCGEYELHLKSTTLTGRIRHYDIHKAWLEAERKIIVTYAASCMLVS